MMSDKKAFYIKLKGQLEDSTEFPSDYMYKFIVPADGNQQKEVQEVFDNKGAVIKTKKSKTGKYISISIVLKLSSADEVISYYKKVEEVEGIISL
ncbi:DUF493 family protein [Polaribacter sp. MED152]|uniref:DUF493 family protein n=1 Tax=Polaribacter sp. MED152 TaxID=313598 RepID=UPI000186F446|nr:hypothetical protein MED152_00250 [Polaribacter sp. MED152]